MNLVGLTSFHASPTRLPTSCHMKHRKQRCSSLPSAWSRAPESKKNQFSSVSERKGDDRDRNSTRLNSSHQIISYAVFCLKKKKHTHPHRTSTLSTTLHQSTATY